MEVTKKMQIEKLAIFYRTAFHSSKWLIFQYLSIQLLWCNFKSIWPTEMYYISKDCIFNGRSAGAFRFSVECVLTEIYRAQVWKFFLHQTLSTLCCNVFNKPMTCENEGIVLTFCWLEILWAALVNFSLKGAEISRKP